MEEEKNNIKIFLKIFIKYINPLKKYIHLKEQHLYNFLILSYFL